MEVPKNFKYTIVINQKILASIAPDINIEEGAIFNYIQGICKEENIAIERQRVDGYTWISYKKMISDMPLLKAKSEASLVGKIKKLEGCGLIQTITIKYKGRPRKYFKIAENISKITEKNGDGEYYKWLLSMGMNEGQAAEIASNSDFLRDKKRPIKRALKKGEADNPAAYIWQTYLYYTGREDPY